jgi:bifunctional DNA-binding transcriptional regulator/antitoxin component of YhaV-PrlF toxin-antitoxin module
VVSESFRTSLGFRGRVTIPSALQEEAGIAVGDRLIVRVEGPGVVVIETPQAVKNRIQSAASGGGEEKENGDQGAEGEQREQRESG